MNNSHRSLSRALTGIVAVLALSFTGATATATAPQGPTAAQKAKLQGPIMSAKPGLAAPTPPPRGGGSPPPGGPIVIITIPLTPLSSFVPTP